MRSSHRIALALLLLSSAASVSAQDVEMLGRRYGTTPPDGYYRELAANPDAYRFTRGRPARMRATAALRAAGAGVPGGPARVPLGPREEPVVGDVYVPVVMGLFSDSPASPPHDSATVQNGYFGGQVGTVTHFYAELSSDSISVIGEVADWERSSMSQSQVAVGQSALVCCGIGDFIEDLVALQGPGVDWGAFDNDGPDGLPNSGDDDGFVDALAVIHPTAGAECDGASSRVWSHKWSLTFASSSGQPYDTGWPATGGGTIHVDDYFVQGAVSCSGGGLAEIGVFSHELGHAFGLPDLYDTRAIGSHGGAGSWDLMASGSFGCGNATPESPCHMGAWSKAMLGWVQVDTLPPDTDFDTLTLPPVETTGTVYRVDAQDGSAEYFLLENRQSGVATYDQNLPSEGLLIWQIDEDWVALRWPSNTVNSSGHMGVWLRQADGLDELGQPGGDRGDAGDPFPGSTGNTAFHAATNPAARSFQGTATGLSVLDIARAGNDMTFHLMTTVASLAAAQVDLVASVADSVQLVVQDATPPVVWQVASGALPDGVFLRDDGVVIGAPLELGMFAATVEATDVLGLTATGDVDVEVSAPSIPISVLASAFLLSGPALDSAQVAFLDRQGNGDGVYDLGDFRAWVLANPDLPLSADLTPVVGGGGANRPRRVVVPMPAGERRR